MDECFAFAGLFLVLLWLIWRKRHLSTFKNLNIPGPEPNLLFGNIIELYRKGPIKCHEEWVNKYGRVLGYFYGMKPVLLVADPQMLKDIFMKDFPKFCNRERFNPIQDHDVHDTRDQSVAVSRGKRWKDLRSVVTPSFTAAKMKQMVRIMNSSIETMIGIITEKSENGDVFDVLEAYGRLTLDIIARTAFGLRTDVQTDDAESRLYKATDLVIRTNFNDPLLFIGLCFPWLKGCCHKAQELVLGIRNGGPIPRAMLNRNLEAVIEHRRKNPHQKGICDLLQFMIDSECPADAKEVDVNLLEIGITEYEEKISEKDIKGQMFTGMSNSEIIATANSILTAGFGPTYVALCFITLLIAKHQRVQQEMYEEIKMLISDDQNIEYDTISKMKYMDKVINEALRMYPPLMLNITRLAVEDVQYGDLKIPKGMALLVPTYLMHHDPELWEEPETFDPERFNDKMNTNGIVYMPFGGGPRNCLGMRFAMLEMKLALAHLLRKFKIALADSQDKFELEFGMRHIILKNGCNVKMELRHPQDE